MLAASRCDFVFRRTSARVSRHPSANPAAYGLLKRFFLISNRAATAAWGNIWSLRSNPSYSPNILGRLSDTASHLKGRPLPSIGLFLSKVEKSKKWASQALTQTSEAWVLLPSELAQTAVLSDGGTGRQGPAMNGTSSKEYVSALLTPDITKNTANL